LKCENFDFAYESESKTSVKLESIMKSSSTKDKWK